MGYIIKVTFETGTINYFGGYQNFLGMKAGNYVADKNEAEIFSSEKEAKKHLVNVENYKQEIISE